VNLILFDRGEIGRPLSRADPRAEHILAVLRRKEGDAFDAGLVNGPRGKGTLVRAGGEALELAFAWGAEPAPPDPIALVVGLPRPQTARKILQEAAALGVRELHFVPTEKGEPGYARSTLWRSGEWERRLRAGAEQAFDTRLPALTHGQPLEEVLSRLAGACGVALDNYESAGPLSATDLKLPLVVAVGPERGWSASERDLFRRLNFSLAHLGPRVLRTETACVAAVAIVRSRLGLM
jgi:RsmE family RNA methyltransferase